MIYDTRGSYFSSFLTSSKHKPSSEEVVGALNDIRIKVRGVFLFSRGDAEFPFSTGIAPAAPRPEPRADGRDAETQVSRGAASSFGSRRARDQRASFFRYPQWVLDDINWAELQNEVPGLMEGQV